jgi:signal transduction histidine kinase
MKSSGEGQVHEYERLKAIYKVSKLLSTFVSVEETFPKILDLTSKVFPLLTAVLIEHWEQKTKTTIWHSADATQEQIDNGIANAKETYIFMSAPSQLKSIELYDDPDSVNEILRNKNTQKTLPGNMQNYIVLPLSLDNLPPLGVIQLEGSTKLNENDLEFAIAFAEIIGVALDRFYKTKRESILRHNESIESRATLYRSKDKIENLETQRELREAFVSQLSHDLRSPLSVILGSAQLILRRPGDLEVAMNSAGRIVKQVQRVGKMITNLLDANRIRSGQKLPLNKELVELPEIIKDTISDLSLIYGKRFVFNHAGDLTCFVDPQGIKRIIENLCNNAIKYGSPTGPVTLTLAENEKEILISVKNEGNVISPKDQKTLFQQFRRADEVDTGNIKGWGIGLTLVKGVAEAHGGSVVVKSSQEQGTVFTVILPKEI